MKTLILSLLLLHFGSKIYAQPGRPNLSFGTNGIVKTDFGFQGNYGYTNSSKQILLQPGGNIYILVECNYFSCISKRLPDGSPDLSYGRNGFSDPIPVLEAYAAVQQDGKIDIAGILYGNQNNQLVARLDTTGRLDGSFGKNGIVNLGFSPSVLAIQNDGKIIVAGSTIRRYNTDGSIDTSFFPQGMAVAYPDGLAIQQDGRIVIIGLNFNITDNASYDFAVGRYNSNGSLDSTFGKNGMQTTDFNSSFDEARSVAIQNDGKIVVGGVNGLVRYNINGTPDSTFSKDGKQASDFAIASIAIQSDGKILAAGGFEQYILARYNSNGSLDKAFGNKGEQTTDLGPRTGARSMVLQSDGKILLTGHDYLQDYHFTAARYNNDGSLDNSFDGDGKLSDTVNYKQGYTVYTGVKVQGDGKVIAVGYTFNGVNADFAIARYNTNGTLDNSFDLDGRTTTDLGLDDHATGVLIQPDGKIVVAGYSSNGILVTYILTRYNSNGSVDSTFSGDGKTTNDFAINSLSLQPDGKIVLGGTSNDDFALARYNTDGSLDTGFSDDGKLTTDFGEDDGVGTVIIQNDGKIVAVGSSTYTDGRDNAFSFSNFAIARYNTNGSFDTTFSNVGKQITTTEKPINYAASAAIESDGKLLVAGYSYDHDSDSPPYVTFARYNNDGSLDNTFADNGVSITQDGSLRYITLQTDGKIIALMNGPEIRRYNPNGNLDSSFGNYGKLTIPQTGLQNDITNSITVFNNKLFEVGSGQFPGYVGVIESFLLNNEAPAVNITSPAGGANFITPGPIRLTAVANDSFAKIKSVDFYSDSTLLFSDSTAPYTGLWKSVQPGSYYITAVATNSNGLKQTSTAVHITVLHNRPPLVNITSPSDSATYTAPATVTVSAEAVAHGGKIVTVKFYNGTTLIHTEENPPYLWTWKNVPAGNYMLTAVATDTYDRTSTSAPVSLIVRPTGALVLSSRLSLTNTKTGINDELSVQLAPNPAHNILNIAATGLQQNKQATISIVSSSGLIVKTVQTSGSAKVIHLNVSSLAGGMYIIKIMSEGRLMYKQFVKL